MKELIDFSSLNEAFGLPPCEPVWVDWAERCEETHKAGHPWNYGLTIDDHHMKTPEGAKKCGDAHRGLKYKSGPRQPLTKEHKKNISKGKEKAYVVEFDDGRKEVIIGMKQFAALNNYNNSHLIQVSKGRRSRHKDIVSVTSL